MECGAVDSGREAELTPLRTSSFACQRCRFSSHSDHARCSRRERPPRQEQREREKKERLAKQLAEQKAALAAQLQQEKAQKQVRGLGFAFRFASCSSLDMFA